MSTSVVVLAAGEQMIILKMIMMSLYTRRPFIILGKHRNWRAWPHQEHTKNDHLTFIMNSLNDGLKTLHNNKMGLRKSRYEGTNRGTKGTVVNQTLLLLPRFPYKKIIIARYLDFRIEKNGKSRYKRAHVQPYQVSFL